MGFSGFGGLGVYGLGLEFRVSGWVSGLCFGSRIYGFTVESLTGRVHRACGAHRHRRFLTVLLGSSELVCRVQG